MRLAIRLLGSALLLSVLAVGCASTPAASPAPAEGSGITITKSFSFDPQQLSVNRGTSVTWTNTDTTTHTVTSGTPGNQTGKFDQRVEGGKTFTFTFADAGTYEVFCNIHQSMLGMVLVK